MIKSAHPKRKTSAQRQATPSQRAALVKAIEIAGGMRAFCAALDVLPEAVKSWLRRQVPSDYVPDIEGLTGVRAEKLLPGVAWHYLRAQPSPEDAIDYIDSVGAGRKSAAACHDGVRWMVLRGATYWPLSAQDEAALRAACCGSGEFSYPGRAEVARLTAECNALRQDAERYRWLRNCAADCDFSTPLIHMTDTRGRVELDEEGFPPFESGEDLDLAVDAAIAKAAQ